MYSLTPYPITPVGNFIGVVLALLPLFSNIRKLSLAVWGYAIWIAMNDFTIFVDTIIWHNNVNVIVPVWCDIVTKLQLGVQIGTRACILVICIHLYNKTQHRGLVEVSKRQTRRAVIYELSLIIGLPTLIMALWIIVQPFRFEIVEELGCGNTGYSQVAYVLQFVPQLATNIACLILAPLTLRTFLRHRKEMNEFLSSGQDITHNKYYRLVPVIIACLDTLLNLPVTVAILVSDIASGTDNAWNYPYIGWKNVHGGDGSLAPGLSLSSIPQVPASEWSTENWSVFSVKWDEWLYVLQAVVFFCVFGTTPEMRSKYRAAFWFIPDRLGYKRKHPGSETGTVSDVAFNSDPAQQARNRHGGNGRGGSLSFLEITIDSASATRSGTTDGLDVTSARFGIETIMSEKRGEHQPDEGRGE